MSSRPLSFSLPSLSTLLALRYEPLHRALADALGGRARKRFRSGRKNIRKEVVAELSRLMGLRLPDHITSAELTPRYSAELVRKKLDPRECEGWDNLMREIQKRGAYGCDKLVENLQERADRDASESRVDIVGRDKQPGIEELLEPFRQESTPPYGDLPLLDATRPLLPQLDLRGDELLERLSGCELDLLGTYSVEYNKKGMRSVITLYYARIGLVAEALGVSAFDLGLVVYVHELAHLLSHRGLDLDGGSWDTHNFENSSTYTLESIAQWYTEQYFYGSPEFAAYDRLLRGQPAPYTAHTVWRNLHPAQELVRMAMIEVRRLSTPDNYKPRGSMFDRVRDYAKFYGQ